ncbi:MAG: hypothetical protein ACJ78Q_11015 [Chloroflexia bacterium]
MNNENVTCASCGAAMPANAAFCPECGRANTVSAQAASPPPPAPETAPATPQEMDAAPAATSMAESASAAPAASESPFSTPMDPGMFATGTGATPESAPETPAGSIAPTRPMEAAGLAASMPEGGTPTVNIGRVEEQPPDVQPAPAWQPGWQPEQYRAESAAPPSVQPDAAWQPGWQPPQYYPAAPVEQQAGQPPAYAPYPLQPQGQAQPPSQPGQAPYVQPPGAAYGSETQAFSQYGGQAEPPVQAYSNAPQPPINYQYQQQAGVAGTPPRDPTVALLLELLGYIGFLGIGHIYAGRVTRGVLLLVGWWCYLTISAILVILVVGLCMLLLALAGPIASGLWIRNELEKENAPARQRYQ